MKFSIITPSLNQGRYIKSSIESVLQQSYPDVDYVVMDGGSRDETLDILKSYPNKFRWHSNRDNGQSAAINQGWKTSDADIYSWLNSDDLLQPGTLEAVTTFFVTHPEIDIVYGDCEIINADGVVIGLYPTRPYHYADLFENTINYIPQPATFIRKCVITSIGYLDDTLHYAMDYDYWLRSGLKHQIAYLPRRLASLRIHQEAKSVASLDHFSKELIQIYTHLFESQELPLSLQQAKNQTLSKIYARAADCSFWGGNLSNARLFAKQSWRLNPLRFRTLWGLILLGNLGLKIAQKYYPNPYLTANNFTKKYEG